MVRSYEDLFVDAEARRRYLAALDELIASAKRYGFTREYVGLVNYRRRLMQELQRFDNANAA